MQGSNDDATWALTSYLVANGIVVTISGWLSAVIGRKRYFLICLSLFTVCSHLCGIATCLPYLRELFSRNGVISLAKSALPSGTPFVVPPISIYQSGFDASWELDLWGQRQTPDRGRRCASRSHRKSAP
jgi:MFS family permease